MFLSCLLPSSQILLIQYFLLYPINLVFFYFFSFSRRMFVLAKYSWMGVQCGLLLDNGHCNSTVLLDVINPPPPNSLPLQLPRASQLWVGLPWSLLHAGIWSPVHLHRTCAHSHNCYMLTYSAGTLVPGDTANLRSRSSTTSYLHIFCALSVYDCWAFVRGCAIHS